MRSISITLLNIYSSLIVRTGSLTIYFDPVKLDLARSLNNADAIVITHEHSDHLDEKVALELQRRSDAPILTTPFVARRIERLGGTARGLSIGDSVELDIRTVLYAEDCLHPANAPLSFVLRAGTVTIYHPADSEPFPCMEQIGARFHPELMLFFSTPRDALIRITELIKPRIVVTYNATRFHDIQLPETRLKMLHRRETFTYPEESL